METHNLELSKNIVAWFKSHTYFKWALFIKDIGMDGGNFYRVMQSEKPTIKSADAAKIVAVLKKYGFEDGEK